jgi:DNA-binding response OmpR family regulator
MQKSLVRQAKSVTMSKSELDEFARVIAREVIAEVRRTEIETQAEAVLSVGSLTINLPAFAVFVGDRRVKFKPREFSVLAALAIHAGHVLSREQLLRLAWPRPEEVDARTVDVHMCRVKSKLRAALGEQAEYIESIRDVGYVLRPPMTTAERT